MEGAMKPAIVRINQLILAAIIFGVVVGLVVGPGSSADGTRSDAPPRRIVDPGTYLSGTVFSRFKDYVAAPADKGGCLISEFDRATVQQALEYCWYSFGQPI
jgi:hypothetical protein